MKTLLILASMMVVLFLAIPYKINAQERKPITNADVVNMVKAELPESNIIKAIQQSITNFDMSPQGLIELTKQGVSSKIIDAMQQAGALTPTQTPQPQTNNPVSNQLALANGMGMGEVVFIDAAGRTEMKITNGEIPFKIGLKDIVPFGSSKTMREFKGNRAKLRTTTTSLTFEVSALNNRYVNEQIGLVILTPKSDIREIQVGKEANGLGKDSSGFRKQDVARIEITEIKEQSAPGSFYKRYSIKPVNPLPPGEYALIANGTYYAFGVDPVMVASSEARIKWTNAPKLLIGSWRFDNSVITYNADGTKIDTYDSGNSSKGVWSIDGDIITLGIAESNGKRLEANRQSQFQIIELTAENFVSKGTDGKQWRAVRVKK